MIFTGYSYRNLLDLKTSNFLFEKLSINEMNYPHKIVFSGEGQKVQFAFSGNKILDNSNKFFWSFNSGESLNLEAKFDGELYAYYINSDLILDGYKNNFKIEKLIVDASGSGLSFNPEFYSDDINLSLSIQGEPFSSGQNVKFALHNSSPAKVKVYSSKIESLIPSAAVISIQENQTGVISGFQTLNFSSKDLTPNVYDYKDFIFKSTLTTNAGNFTENAILNRINVIDSSVVSYFIPSDIIIDHSFSGTSGFNSFTFSQASEDANFSLFMQRDNGFSGSSVTGFLSYSLTGVTGLNTGLYITGINITNSGKYNGVPDVAFTNFSGFKSISVNEKNLISYSAGNYFELEFSGSGTGVLAKAFTEGVSIGLFTGAGEGGVPFPYKFRTITGIQVVSGGYGFTGNYSVKLPISITDYPGTYNDEISVSLGYSPVVFSSNLFVTAGFASGRAILSSGQSGVLSGVAIIAPGSGYSSLQFPKILFKRQSEDSIFDAGTSKASGVCVLNSSGRLSNFDNWTVLAARGFSEEESDYNLVFNDISGEKVVGPLVFDFYQKNLSLRINSRNSDLFESNGLKFKLYESGEIGRSFSVYSSNKYVIPDIPPGEIEGTLIVDFFEPEE